MLPMDSPERPVTRAPGRISQALLRLLMRRATIVAAERLADRFRLITLEGAALRDVVWLPGQKIQIAMGSAFTARTYTPIEWNSAAGRACLLGFAHGDGPGSAWVQSVEPGDECDLFRPRTSIDARRPSRELVLLGDETAMGLAYALTRQEPGRPVACHFEVGDLGSARSVAAQLGIGAASLHARRDGDLHLAEMEAALPAHAEAGALFVLTGKAGTIQRLRHNLRRQGVPTSNILTKAYWAPGKTGFD